MSMAKPAFLPKAVPSVVANKAFGIWIQQLEMALSGRNEREKPVAFDISEMSPVFSSRHGYLSVALGDRVSGWLPAVRAQSAPSLPTNPFSSCDDSQIKLLAPSRLV